MSTPASPAPPPVLNEATRILLHLAAQVPVLAQTMRLELTAEGKLRYFANAAYLTSHPLRKGELTFDADRFAKGIGGCGSGERHCRLWLLNVWDPGHAREQGWTFDLFAACGSLDTGNREAIADWLRCPIFP